MSHPSTITLTSDQIAKSAALLSDEKIASYWDVISSVNKKVNLVSRETTRATFTRLVHESLLPLTVLDQNFPGYIDIGSGGGLPAIPLLMTGRVRQPSDLYERIGKKAEALTQIIKELDLFAHVKPENFGEHPVGDPVSLITMRLVTPEPKLIRQIVLALDQRGVFIYYGLKTLPPVPGFKLTRYLIPAPESSEPSGSAPEPRGFTILSRRS